jgi:hypothetical protein
MVESQWSAPPPAEEAPELEEDLAAATVFDVHAWFEAYLRDAEPAEHPGVPFH